MSFEETVERAILSSGLLLPGETIVTAVSGGPDSTALLHALARLAPRFDWRLVAAHADHGFRGEESAREAESVRAQAASLGLPCEIARLDLPERLARTGGNAQAAAREARYAFLLETANRYGASKLALGHHADDQIETVLMRFVRGTGISGLSGMPARRTVGTVELVRPLLGVAKRELIGYCEEKGLPYAVDSSNEQRKYERNRYRLDVRPFLEQLNPRLGEAILRLADMAREEDAFMEAAAEREMAGNVACANGSAAFDRGWFAALPFALQRRVIKLIWNYLFTEHGELEFAHIETVRNALLQSDSPNLRLSIRDGAELVREYESVRIVRAQRQAEEPPAYRIEVPPLKPGESRTIELPDGLLRAALVQASDGPSPGKLKANEAVFDWESLRLPLTVRTWRRGDRMKLYGMQGSKKLQDLFTDHKIPASLRRKLPLLTDGAGEILWIAELRRSAHAVVSRGTSWVLYMEYSRKESRSDAVHTMG